MTADELLNYCRHELASYMTPTIFEFMESLPRTSNGKMDRVSIRDGLMKSRLLPDS